MPDKEQIRSILEYFDIPYTTEGSNVYDCFGVRCPYCNDHSDHCGIFYPIGTFSCWRCKASGNLSTLLNELVGISYTQYQKLIGQYVTKFNTSALDQIEEILSPTKQEAEENPKVLWPDHTYSVEEGLESKVLDRYLKRRRYTRKDCRKHKCQLCVAGKFMHRLIIPIRLNNRMVSFQAADLTGKSKVKYRSARSSINHFLYNIDRCAELMILVEGVLDVWRLGDGAVATFGTDISSNQRKIIVDHRPEELIIVWDSDAYWKARKVIGFFQPFIDKIKIVKLPQGEDPDSLGLDQTCDLICKETWL